MTARSIGVGLRPLACWDSGFEFRWGHGCFVSCECCVLSGRGLCDEMITRPEEPDRAWCDYMSVIMKLRHWEGLAAVGSVVQKEKYDLRRSGFWFARPSSVAGFRVILKNGCLVRTVDCTSCLCPLQGWRQADVCHSLKFDIVRLYRPLSRFSNFSAALAYIFPIQDWLNLVLQLFPDENSTWFRFGVETAHEIGPSCRF